MSLVRDQENFNPFRRAPGKLPLSTLARNVFLDGAYYDTSGLTPAEQADLLAGAMDVDEGGMFVVWPAAEARRIEYFALSHDLVEAHPDIDCVAMAGVGGSPLGAAAFARQVADATSRKAVGIVGGCGVADLLAETMGGWLDFGLKNRMRDWLDAYRRRLPFESAAMTADEASASYRVLSDHLLVDEPETNTLLNIMLRQGERLRLVVGHSKGVVNVQNAAWAFVAEPLADDLSLDHLHVFAIGCGIALPQRFRHVQQFVGALDPLGWLNTPGGGHASGFHWVGGRTHGLSRFDPGRMPLEALLPHLSHGVRGEVRSIGAGEPPAREPSNDIDTSGKLSNGDTASGTGGATIHRLPLPPRRR